METVTYIAHHGILGQKWGVRRYQRKDGTLTKAGQKRYADAKAFVNRVDGTAPPPKPKPKKISEMTDEELKNAITRMTSEKQAYGLQADIRSYTTPPKQPSAGQKFGAALGKVLLDSAKQAGPDILKAVVSASLGIEMPSKDKNKDKDKSQNKQNNDKEQKSESYEVKRKKEYEEKIALMKAEDSYDKLMSDRKAKEDAKKEEAKAIREQKDMERATYTYKPKPPIPDYNKIIASLDAKPVSSESSNLVSNTVNEAAKKIPMKGGIPDYEKLIAQLNNS